MSHHVFTATLDPQVLACEKFVALAPVILKPATASGPLPSLVSVTISTLEPVFFTAPKFNAAGASCTVPPEALIAAVADFEASATDFVVSVTRGLAGTVAAAE